MSRKTKLRDQRVLRGATETESRVEQRRRRHAAIRSIITEGGIANQDNLRRRLVLQGVKVTQGTLSRDVRELNLTKGPGGYSAIQATGTVDLKSDLREVINRFGTRVRQALNQIVLLTNTGSAQPVAAALDRQGWGEVLGTIAGDDTVLLICADERQARVVRGRIEALLA